jgi:type IV pilus assembly protein PilV
MPRLKLGYYRTLQTGTSLIEALVALLILSIGLLGIAGLTVKTLQFTQGSGTRSAAATLLSDFADRIRSTQAIDCSGPTTSTDPLNTAFSYLNPFNPSGNQPRVPNYADCGTQNACSTPGAFHAYHLERWRLAVANALPLGQIYVTGSECQAYNATIMWIDKDYANYSGTTVTTSPVCDANTPLTDHRNRTCCPSGANTTGTAGVRCVNMNIVR